MEVFEVLQYFLGTAKEVFLCPFPAAWGREAVVVNCFSPGETVVCLVSGERGEHWARVAEGFGLSVIRLGGYGGKPPQAEDLYLLFEAERASSIKGVFVTHLEREEPLAVDLEALGRVCRSFDVLYALDVSESFGVFPLSLDESAVDVAVAESPLLSRNRSLLVVGEKAWRARSSARCPRFALDFAELQRLSAGQELSSSCFEFLLNLRSVGRETVWERRKFLASLFRRGAEALGFQVVHGMAAFPSVTCLRLPEGIVEDEVLLAFEREGIWSGKVAKKDRTIWVRHGDTLKVAEILGLLFVLGEVLRGKGQKVDISTILAGMEVDWSG
jgi:aspartate aminotransferase-like enzyme